MTAINQNWISLLPPVLRERLEGRVQLQKILSNIVWLSMDKLLRLGVGAVVGVWIARYLGPQQFGLLNYAAAFVALFGPLGSLGIESILVRDVLVEPEEERRASLGTAFTLRVLGSVVGAAIACVVIMYLRPGETLVLALVALAAAGVFFQSFDIIDLWFHSQVKAKWGVYPRNFSFLLMTAVRVALLLARAPLIAFAWAALAELALSAAGLVFMYKRKGEHLRRWRMNVNRALRFLKDSWPLAFSSLTVILYMRIGQVMLGSILNDREVGIYSVAVRLAEMWYFIPMSIASSVFPSVIKSQKEDPALYQRRVEMLYGMMSMISVSVALVTFLFSNFIIRVLFGMQFADAGPVLSIYIWASVPVFLNIASTQYLIAENKSNVTLLRTFIGAVCNILLNLVLIPRYGPTGAAFSALLAYSATMVSIALVGDTRHQLGLMLRSLNPYWVYKLFRGDPQADTL